MRRADPLDKLVRYKPLPSQEKFHALESKFKGFSGPIGSGKSAALCHEAIRIAYMNPGRTGLIGAPTYPMLRDATISALVETLEENDVPYEYLKAQHVITLPETGSRILLRSVEEFERLRGTNLAWFGLDELTYVKEAAWVRLEGRLRDPKALKYCGFGVWTPKGFDWVYRRFIEKRSPGYESVKAVPYENRHILKHQPDFYQHMRGSYDEQFFQQEALGEYVNAKGGLVYHAFERARNVAPQELAKYEPLLWALDFNVDPMSSVIAQKGSEGELRVLDEIVLKRASTEDACKAFVNRFAMPPAGIVIYGDASGEAMKTTGYSDYEIVRRFFRELGIRATYQVPKANPPVRQRVAAVNGKLCNAAGQAVLLVDPKCRELIADFEQVAYLEDSMEIDKNRDRKRTHASDALGYLVWQESNSIPKIGERGQRLF